MSKMAKCLVILCVMVASTFAALQTSSIIDPNLSWKVVGGSPAPEAAYPHQISLRKFGPHSCGGSILNSEWVVTAAHCVDFGDPTSWVIVAGSNKVNQGGVRYNITATVVHPEWDRELAKHDIALLKVAGPIDFNDKVQPIALETVDLLGNNDCVLCGWGTTSFPGSSPNDLQHVNLKTISVKQCQEAHAQTREVFKEQICTLTKVGEGACFGDSGGALMRVVDDVLHLIGIVSWGSVCARGRPDVYTRISSYTDWVQENCGNCAKLA